MRVPVNKLIGYSKVANGYEYDTSNGEVYSSRNNTMGNFDKMLGSWQNGYRRYTFMLASTYKTGYRVSMTGTELDLKQKAAAYASTVKTNSNTFAKAVGAAYAATIKTGAAANVPNKGWIIGSVTNGAFSISATPKIHTSEASVNTEIERLAKINVGKTYVKMKLEAFAQAGGVAWM